MKQDTVELSMKIESIVMTSALLLAGFSGEAAAQQIVIGGQSYGPGELVFFGQAAPPPPPSAPGAPAAPMAPMAQMGDIIRLMSGSGSYLGVGVRDVDTERKKALNLKEERGAEITSVEDDSPAAKAGLKTGDVVLEYASTRVESMEQFIRMVRETPSGREVKIAVSRGGSMTTITAKPESGRARVERTIRMHPLPQIDVREWVGRMDSPRAVMSWNSGQLGIEAESLDNQLAEFFGVKQGVLVRSVAKQSAAEKAGIKAGDVITKVEDTPVGSPREVTAAVRNARKTDKTVGLTMVRDKKESTLKVTFEEQAPTPAALPRTRSIQNKLQEL
jgi:serine protease Do